MTDCANVTEHLNDYVDGSISEESRRTVEDHLAGCSRCRQEVRSLESLLTDARNLPRGIQPPPEVWNALDRKLDERAARGRLPRRLAFRPVQLAAAALALVALTAAVTTFLVRDSARTPSRATALAPGEPVNEVEAQFLDAVRELEQALSERRENLSPEALAVAQRNLRVIDSAIAEARSALADNRGNAALASLLWNSYRSKIDLLTRAARL